MKTDVVVIGAGHAGCEAALSCARLGVDCLLFTLNLDAVANMPCNPSIGGTGKSQLVRELDALGGEMAKAADATMLQSRTLNASKGPAVQSLRVQSDRRAYQAYMKRVLEQQDNLLLIQGEVVAIETADGTVSGVVTRLGQHIACRAVVIATGTYLNSDIIVGDCRYAGGPDGHLSATGLTDSLLALGIRLQRFKTGTPVRVLRRSVRLEQLEPQPGDEPVTPFSFDTDEPGENRESCYIAYTNEQTHAIIRQNLDRSPLFGGMIHGVGPRYCPSIEDKVVRFADRERHQLFLEPMGAGCEELYLQGFSSSMPIDVQYRMLHSIHGFEQAQIMRNAYAIEYDCVDPTQLTHSLEVKTVPGLFGAGQFCGTSGYEEAAAQGLIAGINAARKCKGLSPFVLGREESYIGTLIDDIVLKGTEEPYRMMTARCEWRLLNRQDNADERLTPKGYELGLISEERMTRFQAKQQEIAAQKQRMERAVIQPTESVNALLEAAGTAPIAVACRLCELVRRPQLTDAVLNLLDPAGNCPAGEAARLFFRYEGYISRQHQQVERMKKLEDTPLPADLDYTAMTGLRLEARQKLAKLRPDTVGQASRISGVSPADVAVLLIALSQRRDAR